MGWGSFKSKWFLLVFLFIFSFSVRVWQINSEYGFSDEGYHAGLGKIYIHGFTNIGNVFWQFGHEHPPIAKYLYGIADLIYSEGHYLAPRILSSLMGSLSVVLLVLITTVLINWETGILSGFLLSLMPYFIAHNRISGVETPSVFFALLSIWFLISYNQNKKLLFFLLSSISFGLMIGVRFNNGLLGLPILFYILFILSLQKETRILNKNQIYRDQILLSVIYFFVAVIVVYISWPWIWFHPIENIHKSHFVNELVNLAPENQLYFLGTRQASPIYYFPIYFLVTTPGLLLIPFFWGFIKGKSELNWKNYVFILLLFLSPFLLTFTPFRREGIRYILICYPGLAILTSFGIYSIAKKIQSYRYIPNLTLKLGFASTVYLIIIYALIHPYELQYYNEWVGGAGNVYRHRLFQIGFWGSGITNGIQLIDSLPKENPTVDIKVLPFIEVPTPTRKDIILEKSPYADYVMLDTKYEWYYLQPGELSGYTTYKVVNVMGAPIVKIYKKDVGQFELPNPIESSDWKFEANNQESKTNFALDKNLNTMWSSMHAQDSGMFVQVDMETTRQIQGIGLVTWTSPHANPMGYEVEVSKDGKHWNEVAENSLTPRSDIVLDILFPTTTARYVKVINTGSSPLYGWAVHEFYVYPG